MERTESQDQTPGTPTAMEAGGAGGTTFSPLLPGGQFVFAHRWWCPPEDDAAVTLEAAIVGSFEALSHLLYRGGGAPYPITTSMKATIRAWGMANGMEPSSTQAMSPHAPLWNNPQLPHFFKIPDPIVWTKHGIKKIVDIVHSGTIMQFDCLKSKFNLPNTHLFRYLQLRHAYHSQFGASAIVLQESDIESTLRNEPLDKALSTIYKQLFSDTHRVMASCRRRWEGVFPQLDSDDWDDIWDINFSRLISARDHLIQYKFLHWIYLTPARLARIFPSQSSCCWWCTLPSANFMHIFWDCVTIQRFWKEVTECVEEITTLYIRPSVEVCLLGLVDSLAAKKVIRTFLTIAFFYARKTIVLSWKKTSPPTIQAWKALVNKTLPFYKATYARRGIPNKFERVWGGWTKSASTVSE